MNNLKKNSKLIIGFLIILIICLLCFFVYKNLFYEKGSNRLSEIENYEVTKKEITSAENKLKEIDKISSIDIYVNYKIIKLMVELSEDVDFKSVEKISNEAIESFSTKNLGYYDIEIFIDSQYEESEVYPKIGYKNKKNSKFTWNR